MAQVIISKLPPLPDGTGSGTPKGTDLTPATDTTDTTEAATGTTKKYTRAAEFNFYMTAQGYTPKTACLVATTGGLTVTYANGALGVGATLTNAGAQAALSIDGVTLAVGNRVLVKDQVSQFQNGIYIVSNVGSGATNWVMTRATDYDQAAEIAQGDVVFVNQGTVNAGHGFIESNSGPFTIGTTSIIFSALAPSSVGTNLLLTGNSLISTNTNGNIDIVPNGTGQIMGFSTTPYNPIYTTSMQVVAPIASLRLGNAAPTAAFMGFSTRSTSIGSFVALQAGDPSGRVVGFGDDGTTFKEMGLTQFEVSGAVSSGIVPSSYTVYTTNSAGTRTLGMTLSEAQVLTLANALPVGSGGLGITTTPSNGQIPIGNGTRYTAATITPGTGITVNNGSGSLTINATGNGLATNLTTALTTNCEVNNRYITGNAGTNTYLLPATASLGAVIEIQGVTGTSWVLTANTGQTIKIGGSTTSSAGTLTSSAITDNVSVVCIVANTTWKVQWSFSAGLTIA